MEVQFQIRVSADLKKAVRAALRRVHNTYHCDYGSTFDCFTIKDSEAVKDWTVFQQVTMGGSVWLIDLRPVGKIQVSYNGSRAAASGNALGWELTRISQDQTSKEGWRVAYQLPLEFVRESPIGSFQKGHQLIIKGASSCSFETRAKIGDQMVSHNPRSLGYTPNARTIWSIGEIELDGIFFPVIQTHDLDYVLETYPEAIVASEDLGEVAWVAVDPYELNTSR